MSLTLVAPPHLPEALAHPAAAPLSLPHLEMLLTAASITGGPEWERWMCDVLGISVDGDPPVAALRLAAEDDAAIAAQARDGYWLCADPISTTTGLDSVRVDGSIDDLSLDDARALIATLDDFFRADGLRFIAPAPAPSPSTSPSQSTAQSTSTSRWYVRADSPQRLATTPLEHVVGRSMLQWMPAGVDAAAWRARLNETQMLLHAHPVNAARAARGLATISSCWLWGGGSWPQFTPARIDVVIGAPAWVTAACRENGVAIEEASVAGMAAMPSTVIASTMLPSAALANAADRRCVLFAPRLKHSSAAEQWCALDTGVFAALADVVQREAVSLIVPWTEGSLRIDIPRAKSRSPWRRLLGRRDARPAAVAEALRSWRQ